VRGLRPGLSDDFDLDDVYDDPNGDRRPGANPVYLKVCGPKLADNWPKVAKVWTQCWRLALPPLAGHARYTLAEWMIYKVTAMAKGGGTTPGITAGTGGDALDP
jgi:hypothetical protein